MKPQMAGETDWELWWRMSDSMKPGDKSLYIMHVFPFIVCLYCGPGKIWAFNLGKDETPGRVYREKLVAPAKSILRRLMYGEQTEDQDQAKGF